MTAMTPTILVNSVPKSGTYLAGRLLECAGIPATGFHLRRDRYWDWNDAESLDSIVKAPKDFLHAAALEEALSRIGPGFTYAHLNHDPDIVAGLGRIADLRHVFLCRNLRDALVSQMRFLLAREAANDPDIAPDRPDPDRFVTHLRQHGRAYVDSATKQMGWITDRSVTLILRFEDLVRDEGDAVAHLLDACGLDGPGRAAEVRAEALGSRTRTFSGRKSVWQEYWSPEAETLFQSSGAPALNAAMGYDGGDGT